MYISLIVAAAGQLTKATASNNCDQEPVNDDNNVPQLNQQESTGKYIYSVCIVHTCTYRAFLTCTTVRGCCFDVLQRINQLSSTTESVLP